MTECNGISPASFLLTAYTGPIAVYIIIQVSCMANPLLAATLSNRLKCKDYNFVAYSVRQCYFRPR